MKNICVFTNSLSAGGAEKQALLLCKALNEDYNVHLLVYYSEINNSDYLDFLQANNIKVISLRNSHLNKVLSFRTFLKNESIDVIFSRTTDPH